MVVAEGADFGMSLEDCTVVLGRFLVSGTARVEVVAERCLFVNGVMMTNRVGRGLRWEGSGNVYQGRGLIAPGVADPHGWSGRSGVDERDFRIGQLPLPERNKSGRVQLERQVVETHRGWPADRRAGADAARLPSIP